MNESAPFAVPVEEHEDYAIVRPRGYLNALTADQIEKTCGRLIEEDVRYFIVNFRDVSMINTIGISILVGIINRVLHANGLVYFTELGTTDRQIFQALNLTSVSLIFETDDEARDHLGLDREAVRRAAGE